MFRLGILQRYVIDQVVRSFVLALTAITTIFVLIMVMTEATRQGLSPQDIIMIVPFIIPSTLPYTVPVALLFAVSVVYGRMAGDNEIVAVKTAGQSALAVVWPILWFGLAIGTTLAVMSAEVIPRATAEVKRILFRDLEDRFYKQLKKDREFNNSGWPFFIKVNDIEGRTMLGATFKHRVPGHPEQFDLTVTAKKAVVHFDTEAMKARVTLHDAVSEGGDTRPFIFLIDGQQILEYPIPDRSKSNLDSQIKIQEKTNTAMAAEQVELLDKIGKERKRRAYEAGLQIAMGRLSRVEVPGVWGWQVAGVDWPGIREAFSKYTYWKVKYSELETERNMRVALAFGSFFFVLLGAPVGIRFARRDFLSAFISCFVPIILLYYPLLLGAVNMGKQGTIPPICVWASNGLLAFLAGFVALPPVMKH